jgi:hypothetical protein
LANQSSFYFTDNQKNVVSQTATVFYSTGTAFTISQPNATTGSAMSIIFNGSSNTNSQLLNKKIIFSVVDPSLNSQVNSSLKSTDLVFVFKVFDENNGNVQGQFSTPISAKISIDRQLGAGSASTFNLYNGNGNVVGSATKAGTSSGKYIYNVRLERGDGVFETSQVPVVFNNYNTSASNSISVEYASQLYIGDRDNWRINVLNLSGIDRLNFEYYDAETQEWVVGVPFIIK